MSIPLSDVAYAVAGMATTSANAFAHSIKYHMKRESIYAFIDLLEERNTYASTEVATILKAHLAAGILYAKQK